MAQNISGQTLPGPYPALPFSAGSSNLVYNGGTTTFSTLVVESKTLVLAENTGSASHTITFTSTPDGNNRTGDLTDTISAGHTAMYGPFRQGGWTTSGNLAITVSDVSVNVGVITLP